LNLLGVSSYYQMIVKAVVIRQAGATEHDCRNGVQLIACPGRWLCGGEARHFDKRIVGTLIGALILGFLNNGLNLLGVSSYYQMIVKASTTAAMASSS
jgi:ribose/xylose/arabinose/galactoside ABC-type transport system permease subunit